MFLFTVAELGFTTVVIKRDLINGVSATAMHYVSEKPCNIQKHVHMVGANPRERKEFEDPEKREAILLARAKELSAEADFCMNLV